MTTLLHDGTKEIRAINWVEAVVFEIRKERIKSGAISSSLRFQTCPRLGEVIKVGDDVYEVVQVSHLPAHGSDLPGAFDIYVLWRDTVNNWEKALIESKGTEAKR